MDLFEIALIPAALLCSLVAGLLVAFAIIVMPGIRGLDDREFVRSFPAPVPGSSRDGRLGLKSCVTRAGQYRRSSTGSADLPGLRCLPNRRRH